MGKTRMRYFQHEDVLHITIARGTEASSVELEPNVTAELNARGELIGIEILDASRFLRDSLLESVQAKMLRLSPAPALSK
jgi:uncharacterized protein YuzE